MSRRGDHRPPEGTAHAAPRRGRPLGWRHGALLATLAAAATASTRRQGRVRVLEREQRIELPLERCFEFFAQAANLEAITPPWLGFSMLTPEPIAMHAGALIEYRIRLHGVPIRWRTRIEAWEPPTRFVDVQLRGPYALWEHTHTFEGDGDNATIIRDRVRYALPFAPFGELAHPFVRRDVAAIFDYRAMTVAQLLTPPRSGDA